MKKRHFFARKTQFYYAISKILCIFADEPINYTIMTMQEIFDTIVEVSAEVRGVEKEVMYSDSHAHAVAEARSLAVFWLTAAGFETDDIVRFACKRNAESINKIKRNIEVYWTEKYCYRECIIEVGRRLHEHALMIDNPFDINVPIEHIRRITKKR